MYFDKRKSKNTANINSVKILFLLIPLFPLTVFSDDTLRVPVMVGQTGASTAFGTQEIKGYILAAEEWNAKNGINGKEIELQVEDTQTKQSSIVTSFQKLSLSNPTFILGPTWLDSFPAIIPIAKRKRIALITPRAAVEAFGKYAGWPISFYFNTTSEVKTLVRGLKERKIDDKIALIYEQGPYAELVRKLLLKQTSNIVFDIGVQAGNDDFRATLTRLASKKPKVLIVLVWDERSLLSLFQQLKILSPNLRLATIHDGEAWTKHKTFAPNINQLIYSKFLVNNRDFIERFKKRFDEKPLLTASTAYDAANNVFTAISKGATTGSELHKYLNENELKTVSFGKIKLNSRRGVPTSEVIVEEFIKK